MKLWQASLRDMATLGPIVRALSLIFIGCVINNYALECIVTPRWSWTDKKAGSLFTLLQFAFVAACSAPRNVEGIFKRRTLIVPLKYYAGQTCLFFAMSYLNNLAFAFGISQPLHMIFRY